VVDDDLRAHALSIAQAAPGCLQQCHVCRNV